MLAIWSKVPLPFLNPAGTSGSTWFTYCWSLAWRILSIILLACEMSATVFKIRNCIYIYIYWTEKSWHNILCIHQWHPTPVLLPGKSHGRRSLVGCSPSGRSEWDTTVRLHFHFSLSHIGEGNGNPLQCSCLENPRDGGAWWAAVYGVAQSRTRLKRLSSSSSSSSNPTPYLEWPLLSDSVLTTKIM